SGDAQIEARHRHRADTAARPDHHRQISGKPRSAVGWPLHVRNGRWLERRRDAKPWRQLRDALQAAARAGIGDERVMDEGRSAISRRVRQLRSRMALSETEAETTSAPAHGRRERPHPETRGRILRWLVPA